MSIGIISPLTDLIHLNKSPLEQEFNVTSDISKKKGLLQVS